MGCMHVPQRITNTFDDYKSYEDAIYQVFLKSFSYKKFTYCSKRIVEKKYPLVSEKSGTFWHIISTGDNESNKLPDFNRYETIAWPGFILDYCLCNCQSLLIWEAKKKGKVRVHIYCREIEYIVVLEKHTEYYIFWTAFPVIYEHTKKKLLKEYNNYLEKNDLN